MDAVCFNIFEKYNRISSECRMLFFGGGLIYSSCNNLNMFLFCN